jgi:predicted transglutaminase-like cysteine proteinase
MPALKAVLNPALWLLGLLLAAPAASAPALDAARWAELVDVSRQGFQLEAVRDQTRFARADYWQVADASGGDCEDKALLARAQLMARGWPPESLRLALAWTEEREYHAVLTVDVERDGKPATYVIDGRFPWVVGWERLTALGYRWDRRQAAGGDWRRIVVPPIRP